MQHVICGTYLKGEMIKADRNIYAAREVWKMLSKNSIDELTGSFFGEFNLQIIVTEFLCKVDLDMMKSLEWKVKGFAQKW